MRMYTFTTLTDAQITIDLDRIICMEESSINNNYVSIHMDGSDERFEYAISKTEREKLLEELTKSPIEFIPFTQYPVPDTRPLWYYGDSQVTTVSSSKDVQDVNLSIKTPSGQLLNKKIVLNDNTNPVIINLSDYE